MPISKQIRSFTLSTALLYNWYAFNDHLSLLTRQIEDQNLVSFLPLDVTQEDSVNTVLSHIDNMMQYGEDEEPKVPKDMDEGGCSL